MLEAIAIKEVVNRSQWQKTLLSNDFYEWIQWFYFSNHFHYISNSITDVTTNIPTTNKWLEFHNHLDDAFFSSNFSLFLHSLCEQLERVSYDSWRPPFTFIYEKRNGSNGAHSVGQKKRKKNRMNFKMFSSHLKSNAGVKIVNKL